MNAVVNVSYSTKIKAETPDDAPYIKGLLAAIGKLTDEQEIEKATAYLNIWRSELEEDHIGKVLSYNAEFTVFVPLLARDAVDINSEEALSELPVDDAEIEVRVCMNCYLQKTALFILRNLWIRLFPA